MTQDELFASILLALGAPPLAAWDSAVMRAYHDEFVKIVRNALENAGLGGLQLNHETKHSYFCQFVLWHERRYMK